MPKIPEDDGMAREVYVAVRVDLNAAGEPICAVMDCENAPWAYCAPSVWEPEQEKWREATEEEADTTEAFLEEFFARKGAR